MCDYKYSELSANHGPYCQRKPQFWVQSTVSAHNVHACAQHLARMVRVIEERAKPFQLGYRGPLKADGRYSIRKSGDAHWPADTVIHRLPHSDANGALVTVKPYNRSRGYVGYVTN